MQTIAIDLSSTNRHVLRFVFVTSVLTTALFAPNFTVGKPIELFSPLCLAVTIFQISNRVGG